MLLSLLHYVFSAVALRGAAGRPLPLVTTTLAQFAASAANRITPGGLGAVAVNTRYLVCRGLPLSRAAVAVAVLQVAGVPADLLLLGAVLGLGGGNGRMLDALGDHAAHAAGLVPPVPLLIAGGVLLPAAVLWAPRGRSAVVGRAVAGFADLCRQPTRPAAHAGRVRGDHVRARRGVRAQRPRRSRDGGGPRRRPHPPRRLPGGRRHRSAIPLPGGVGSTETALVAALAALGTDTGAALHAVLLFRAVTFWAPVPLGLLSYRTLRR